MSPLPHPPSPRHAEWKHSHSFWREEFFSVIHPSCGRLHGQLKKKLFGSSQTSWPHVAAQPPLRSAFIPPWDLTSDGSGVRALAVSSEMEKGEKHRDCRQTWQFVHALQALSYIHNRRQLSPRWFTPLVLPLIFILIILCYISLVGRRWRLKPLGNHSTDDINCFGHWVKDICVTVTGLWCNCLTWAWWWVRKQVEKWRSDVSEQGHCEAGLNEVIHL